MYQDTLNYFAELAVKKASWLRTNRAAFAIAAMMAGAYVGLGIILIFSVAGPLDASVQKLVMGLSFGIALTLIVFAGAELFTGHTMYMTIGLLHNKTTLKEMIAVWCASWSFNLIGAVALAIIYVAGGGGVLLGDGAPLLNKVASYKMNSPALDLLARAILCNWLVCLALWMAARCKSDSGKTIVIFWCLFAFISSGYEHSVANMTLLTIALMGEHSDKISLLGMAHNLLWVTLGNIIGGAVFMALGYYSASGSESLDPELANDVSISSST